MDTLKRFGKYLLWIILFWILTDILIYFGMNSTYKKIDIKNTIPTSITVERAEATTVNGRINGTIQNSENDGLSGKYLKINLYSSIGNILGTKYIEIGNMGANETKEFETYFKIQEVKAYDVTIVDEKEDISDENFSTEDLTKWRVLMLLAYTLMF